MTTQNTDKSPKPQAGSGPAEGESKRFDDFAKLVAKNVKAKDVDASYERYVIWNLETAFVEKTGGKDSTIADEEITGESGDGTEGATTEIKSSMEDSEPSMTDPETEIDDTVYSSDPEENERIREKREREAKAN